MDNKEWFELLREVYIVIIMVSFMIFSYVLLTNFSWFYLIIFVMMLIFEVIAFWVLLNNYPHK